MLWSCENRDGGLPSVTLSIPGCQDPHLPAGARLQPVPLAVPPLIVPYTKHLWSPKQGLGCFSQPVSMARATPSSRRPPHNLSGDSESLCLCRSLCFHSPDVTNTTIFFLRKTGAYSGCGETAPAALGPIGSNLGARNSTYGRGSLDQESPRPSSSGFLYLLFPERLEAGSKVRTTGFCQTWLLG